MVASLYNGINFANFQIEGYIEVINEQLMILVSRSRITSSVSLIHRVPILSVPGALFEGVFRIIFRIWNLHVVEPW